MQVQMSGRGQIAFGLVFVALAAGALFGELEVARQHDRDPNVGWLIGAAGFGLPGLLNIALGVRSGGLSSAWGADLSMARRAIAVLGLTAAVCAGVAMAIGIYNLLIAAGGDCGGNSGRACPEGTNRWFFVLFGSMLVMMTGVFASALADPSSRK